MISIITDTAAFVLPVGVSVVAAAAAFGAFAMRPAFAAGRVHVADLGSPWYAGNGAPSVKRTTGTSYVPQSRGSTG